MREVDILDAKSRLGTLLNLVERGEEIVILRGGKPVARLVRETGIAKQEKRKPEGLRTAPEDSLQSHNEGTLGVRMSLRKLSD